MGRIFEKRKATMFARYDRMAKAFARMERAIVLAVRAGGPNPETNPTLRRALQNARSVSMPKDKSDAAIKRASGKDQKDLEVLTYEGYAPHGVAVLIEAATDNPARTAPNVRSIFKSRGGNLAVTGSVSFLFRLMGVFRLEPEGYDHEELELDLIDHGLEEMGESTGEKGEPQVVIRCAFDAFGTLQQAIEERGLPLISSEPEYIAQNLLTLPDAQADEVLELIGALEADDDVQRVFHNLG